MSPRKVPAATAAAMADDPVPLYKSARGLQANMASLMNGVDVEMNDVGRSGEVVPVLRSKSCSKSRSHRELREELLGISRPSVGNRELRSNSVVRRSPRTKLNEAGSVPGQGVRVIRQPAKSPMMDVLHSADESLSHIEEVSGKMAHSPLRSRVEAMESMSKSLRPSERTYHRKLRSPHASMEGTAELYNGEEISVVVQRKGWPRQHKRKLSESNPILPPLQPIEPGSRSARGEITSEGGLWLHAIEDLIMWKDVQRSSLLFGASCFFILSASFVKDMSCRVLTLTAYVGMIRLAAVFFHRTFLSSSSRQSAELQQQVTEEDILRCIRVVLPAINLAFNKSGELFSGDPATTLKVAAVLWLVARMGYTISLWSFLRFGVFCIPCLGFSFGQQLFEAGRALFLRAWMLWTSCSHKKAVIAGTCLMAWNLSSVSARLFGAFFMIVALRLYQQMHNPSFGSHSVNEDSNIATLALICNTVTDQFTKDI
ncbi:unnamed protein product [Sphagnum jensenii]|uniref:Reticulon domain-containing protein n=1 Tax=Sphagnum jensenii TaxID=128206 RepID=A0ABP1B9M6_9BRYO